jgi:hypothetical protein
MWLWHVSFSSPGTLNDITIWDRSPLLKSFLDGSFTRDVDCNFEVGGEEFSEMWLLVDGIYPPLSRFVKSLQVPTTHDERRYTTWQESSRKSIERTFGCLQRKFHILVKSIEQWYIYDINDIVLTCSILHNMMVQQRVTRHEQESASWYEVVTESTAPNDLSREIVEQQCAGTQHYYRGSYTSDSTERRLTDNLLEEVALHRWGQLYNKECNVRLRLAIIRQLASNNDRHGQIVA